MYRNQFESITLMMSAHKMTSDWKEVDGCKCACLPQIPICHSLKKKKEEKKKRTHIYSHTIRVWCWITINCTKKFQVIIAISIEEWKRLKRFFRFIGHFKWTTTTTTTKSLLDWMNTAKKTQQKNRLRKTR